MPDVTVTVPGLLARFTGGRRAVPLRADTLRGALDALVEDHPALEPHLFDGAGRPRPHLRLVHSGAVVEWDEGTAVALDDGDEVEVLQAVSGG